MENYSKSNQQLDDDSTATDANVAALIADSRITVVDTSMYFTPDGSTTILSWEVAVV